MPAEAAPTGTVEAEVAAPAEVAPAPVETRGGRPGRGRARAGRRGEAQVAAPAEVAPEPVAVEAQVAAPAEVAPEPVAADAAADEAQVDVAATAAVQ